MINLKALIGMAVLLVGTLVTGWLQGRLTNRWGVQPDMTLAAERLRLPSEHVVGNWRLKSETEFAPEVVRVLECPAHISRVYEHRQTGDEVTVGVMLGPPGPISVHTPEICYSSRDFTITGARKRITIEDASGKSHTLWELPLTGNGLDKSAMRVFYGWSTGTAWEAVAHPRFGFGGMPHLYKIQVAVTSRMASQATDFDPAHDFLSNFLVELQPQLVEAQRTALVAN
jgi:Protein of unknown function (DUF3485)